jgi:hydroxyacylglutathione hydrolase
MVVLKEDKDLRIEQIDVGSSIWANTYLVTCLQTGESVMIDASGKAEAVLEQVKDKNLKYILMTHNHKDHIGALAGLRKALRIPVGGHPNDADEYPIPLTLELNDGDKIAFGKQEMKVIHTPGHTRGSLCFMVGNHLFSGDTLLPGGPGYTNSPAALEETLITLIRRIFDFPDDTIVYSGHGETTVLGKEKAGFKTFASKPHTSSLCGDVTWLSK